MTNEPASLDATDVIERYADKLKAANHQIILLELSIEAEKAKVAELQESVSGDLATQLDDTTTA